MNFRALERRLTEDLPFILGGLYLVTSNCFILAGTMNPFFYSSSLTKYAQIF